MLKRTLEKRKEESPHRGVSSSRSLLEAILMKMIRSDHGGWTQPAWMFLFSCRMQGAGFSASSAIQPPWHANYFRCLSSWAPQPPQLIASSTFNKQNCIWLQRGKWMSIRAFLLLGFLRELADNVGGKTAYLWKQDFFRTIRGRRVKQSLSATGLHRSARLTWLQQ